MKSALGIPSAIEEYVRTFGVREHPALRRCREETQASNPAARMQIGEDQGAFMGLLAKLVGAVRCVEVGVFTGYSSLAVALALPDDGRIVALDISKDFTDTARGYWEEAGMSRKIDLRVGPRSTASMR
jgi:predicted O-methyltransferase YrrM